MIITAGRAHRVPKNPHPTVIALKEPCAKSPAASTSQSSPQMRKAPHSNMAGSILTSLGVFSSIVLNSPSIEFHFHARFRSTSTAIDRAKRACPGFSTRTRTIRIGAYSSASAATASASASIS